MEDGFDNYSSGTNLNGEVPPVGLGTAAWVVTSPNSGTITTDGKEALISTAGIGTSSAVGNWNFSAQSNKVYTLQGTFYYTGTTGTTYSPWAAVGFSTNTNGGASTGNTGPWMLIRTQQTSTSNPTCDFYNGTTNIGSVTLNASNFNYTNGPASIAMTVLWNTGNNTANFYINGVLQTVSASGITGVSSTSFNAFFKGFETGTTVNLQNIALQYQPWVLPTVFFSPNPGAVDLWPSETGTNPSLFTDPTTWPQSTAHVAVFQTSEAVLEQASGLPYVPTDGDIKAMFDFLHTNSIKLCVVIEPLEKPTNGCWMGNQGYGGVGPSNVMCNNITRINSEYGTNYSIDQVILDEPVTWGYWKSPGCNTALSTLASQCTATVQNIETKLGISNLPVGLAEEIGDFTDISNTSSTATLPTFLADFQSDYGTAFAYFHDDNDWATPLANNVPYALTDLTNAGNIPFGIDFDGNHAQVSTTASNANWILCAEENISEFYAMTSPPALNTATAQVGMQDYDPYTTNTLPESSPGANTFLINYYFTNAAVSHSCQPAISFPKML